MGNLKILGRHLLAVIIASSCLLPLILFDYLKPNAPFSNFRSALEVLIAVSITVVSALGCIVEIFSNMYRSIKESQLEIQTKAIHQREEDEAEALRTAEQFSKAIDRAEDKDLLSKVAGGSN